MIDHNKQKQIITTIAALCNAEHLPPPEALERMQMLFIGVLIALADELPPFWQINIQCARPDRIMATLPDL